MSNNKLKVLQVFGSLNIGGAESRMMDVYRNINRDICDFEFLTQSYEKQYFEDEINCLGGKIHKIASPREIGIFKHFSMLRKIMKNGDFDAVHAHTSYHCGLVMLAAWVEHINIRIAHARTNDTNNTSFKKRVFIWFGKFLINLFSTHRFAISLSAGKFLFGNKHFEVVPNAIKTENYQIATNKLCAELKSELGIPENSIIIGQIGRFVDMKNHKFTVEWFKQFIEICPNAILVFVGDGQLRFQIENLINELNLKDRVVFTGVRGDIANLINVFDFLIFPSIYEGLGGVVLEAQAAGKPIIVSDTIPLETDLGLDLVERCSLSPNFDEWNNAAQKCLSKEKPQYDIINKKFYEHGYLLDSVTDKFLCAYGETK